MKLNLKTEDKDHQVAGLSIDGQMFMRTGKETEKKKKLTTADIKKKGVGWAAQKLFEKHYLDQ